MDVVLLDLTLPDMDGLGLCRIIRATDDIPIIALAERATESERIRPQPGRSPTTLVRGSLYINPTPGRCGLAERSGTVVSRQQLMQEIWGCSMTTTRFASRTIDTHRNTLRRKLGSNDRIRTVRGSASASPRWRH